MKSRQLKIGRETGKVIDRPRSGRPRCTTPRQDGELEKFSKSNLDWFFRRLAEWNSSTAFNCFLHT